MPGFDSTDYDFGSPVPERDRERRRLGVALALGAVVLAAAAGWYILRERAPAAPSPDAAAPSAAADAGAGTPVAEAPLPSLSASDAFLRELVGGLTAHPGLASWLVGEDLARRFVAAVIAVAEGASPATPAKPLSPAGAFLVTRSDDGRLVVDPASWLRYDTAVEVFTSIDTQGAAATYRRVRPLLDEAYREIGDPASSLDATLARAIDRLLAVPVPAEPVELTDQGGSYHWADRDLEQRPIAEKHLLRLGPDNARRVQAKLAELEVALALPPS